MDPQYKGYVYDLDGTVIRLPVNWSTVEQKLAEIIASSQYNATNYDAWELLEICENIGRRTEALKYIRKHEVKSAPDAVKLPLAETLSSHNTPVGICSLNCHEACKQALKSHQLNEYVDVIIGRDSVENRKPHPEPLIRTIENLGLNRDEVKFIGDSKTDADMAQRANVTFEYAYRK